jgi:O-antigen ligase
MSKLTRCAMWMFVFSVPWGIVNTVAAGTSITRFLGLAALGLGLLTALTFGRIRKPGPMFWVTAGFVSFVMLSQVWSIAPAVSAERASTYLQFLGLVWLMGEFVRTRDEHDSLSMAFWCGALVLAADLLWNFKAGRNLESRYTAADFNPNYVGFTLVVGFPMAWRLFSTRRGFIQALACLYCIVAPIALLLTASRSAALAGGVALCFVPLSRRRLTVSWLMKAGAIGLAASIAVGVLVPRQNWERVLSTRSDIESGYLGGRGEIWDAGLAVFLEHPVLGSGVGAFPTAVAPLLKTPKAGHNTPLTLLVELGVLGLTLFGILLATGAWMIAGLPPLERKLWAILMTSWLIMAMAHDSHVDKVTWVMLGLMAAQHALSSARVRVPDDAPVTPYGAVGDPLVPYARRV